MNAAAGWLLIFCAVLISGDIFAREVLRASIGATLEISSYILAVSIAATPLANGSMCAST